MATWKVEVAAEAKRDLEKLDPQVTRRIERFLYERVSTLENPRSIGQALQGEKFGELWRYRVGDWRIICQIQDAKLVVLALRVGHRREVYER
ncbi:MAG TPA: type II toxin-antitoxin system RelE/ParE family toxin [Terracidiphilus sp.]